MAAGAPQYVAEIDRDGTILALNGPVGRSVTEIVGTRIHSWVSPDARAALDVALTEAFATGEPRCVGWNGVESGRPYESRITPLLGDGHIRAVVTTEDVTEREREHVELRDSEQRFHALVLGAFEGLAITVDGKILVANEALARIIGAPVESLVGRSGYEFTAPESVAVALEHVRRGDEAAYEVTGLRADGSRYPVEILGRNIVYMGKPARLTGFRDLTERHRLERERREIEEQMRQAQKLESLGMLAGGIAHDFNNVLMAVLANAELELRTSTGKRATRLTDIRSAAMRGRELTRQLLNYAAQGPLTNQPTDLNELVRDTIALIGISISKKAELALHLAPEPAVVECDPGQLRQLIMNLVINASEALADHVGRIEIHIQPVQVTPGDLDGSPLLAEIPAGRAVMLSVRDTGHGMSAETRKRIFEPFFTTKLAGRGLGLASVLNVVRGHRGAIRVWSEPGAGTAFTVWLRRCDAAPALRSTPPQTSPAHESRGLVLVAEDEPMLRTLARERLLSLGFDAVVAEDGEHALQLFDEHADQLVLVVLDLTMPKLSGVEARRRIRERTARLPILCTSGYSAELVASELASDPATRFLAKPYSLTELTSVIDGLLALSS
jgi:two-component system, cell cycle sensor histidine kinase and response regulator CckA